MRYIFALWVMSAPAFADPPVIEGVRYDGERFDVTLSHGDTGWEDYADGWRVELADGTVLGTRVLHHPHVNEQPFTRSHRIEVPTGVTEVFVRARDSVGGWAEEAIIYELE